MIHPSFGSLHGGSLLAAGMVGLALLCSLFNVPEAQGASDSLHWSYRPLQPQPFPTVPESYVAQNPIDRFILARLAEKQISPANPATPLQLIRRIYFDLVGLPPAPERVDEFLLATEASRERAISALIDELLQSPHYAERWARHWLDVARYADSNGQEGDAGSAHRLSLSRLCHSSSQPGFAVRRFRALATRGGRAGTQ